MSRRVLIAALLALATPAAAQDVQRCESADGKVSYANGACPHGTAAVRTLPPAGSPSAADQKAARLRAQQDARSAAALDQARRTEEEQAARERQRAMARAQEQQTKCRRLLTSLQHAQEDLAGASRAHKRTEAQRRVVRAEDLYREDCGAPKH